MSELAGYLGGLRAPEDDHRAPPLAGALGGALATRPVPSEESPSCEVAETVGRYEEHVW